jgi:hypothetical protein
MMPPFITTIKEPVRRAHCSFCGGLGADNKAETVITPIGTRYRIPLSHASCKQSVLSLSLSLSLSLDEPRRAAKKARRKKGAMNEPK